MAKAKPTAPVGKLPTFAKCSVEGWWDDDDGGPWVPSISTIQNDVLNDITEFLELTHEWRRIQDDPDEASARAEYASHAARYLTGIFPNARVNVGAYAEAAGDELGRFSADIVKLVAERARRSSKTLPSVAHLAEWAQAEDQRRERQYSALLGAMRDREAADKRGEEQARAVIEKGGLAGKLTAERLAAFHRGLTFLSIGIQPPPPTVYACGGFFPCYVTKMAELYRRIVRGDEAASAWLVEAARESERLLPSEDASGEVDEASRGRYEPWHECMAGLRKSLTALLAVELTPQPPPKPGQMRPAARPADFAQGAGVHHMKFGQGVVIERRDDTLHVRFADGTARWLMSRFLELIEQSERQEPHA